ncbi:hypothetical protein QZM97_19180 [Burkholderia orbicola]|uniref:Uncharacterized protein n=4 Tax=Burkholderia cepacia complex TaxID=87882 RepID=A0A3R9BIK5_9BURK|nr:MULTISPECIES: hypothetical protein [Burkholderia]BEV50259.1 hypothetical protein BconGalA64_27580 [Burkholderia contaminans]ABK11933.1 conserved hypothetical protein [Burkholderia cenocepacia HI2424]ACA94207.1 conserved hypothetical protein [Burkholderia orbicola MC0-3]AQQ29937.1 hypothetical protein A8E88_32095 [Burkholderia cenocepacia]AQT53544.1 hypothetical protein BHQ31_26500 [Burkholderia cenocepacia]
MNKVAQSIIDAHGGIEQWRKFREVRADLIQGGALWGLKGQSGVLDRTRVSVATDRQWASHAPFATVAARSEFTGDRIALLDDSGRVIEAQAQPRELFAGHTLETPWNALQLAFFAGCAMWTYLNSPFLLAFDGVECEDVGPWSEQGERWRKIHVVYPATLEVFSKVQAMYVGPDNLIRRLDYDVEIAGNTPGAHYVSDYVTVSGIRVPMRRRIYPRMPDGTSISEPLVVSIDLENIELL